MSKNRIRFYNTLTRQLEDFKPLNEDLVSLYSCGPTVYSTPHIGNMRAYTFVDLLVRTLKVNGYNVKNLINITDVGHLTSDADDGDDKLEKVAKQKQKNAYDIAEEYTNIFFRYLEELNITKPTKFPKATDHIKEQIEMISILEDKGYTYITKDGVYFNTAKFDKYSELSKLDIEGLRKGERVDFGDKVNSTDFALWKFSPKNEQRDMEWDSPWGKGFPGWHIECSAMACKHLGEQIDIHTGGIDHIPIHHTNEIAQTESVTDKKFVNYWLHVNFLQLLADEDTGSDKDSELKMSKSKGTAYTIDQLIEMGFNPLSLKYFYLSAHYRNELKFNFNILKNQEHAFNKLRNKIHELRERTSFCNYKENDLVLNMLSLLNEDLDTPKMLAYFHEELNNSDNTNEDKLSLVYYFDLLTGLELLNYKPRQILIPENVIQLAEDRLIARKNKDWTASDKLRELIKLEGFEIKDSKDSYELNKI